MAPRRILEVGPVPFRANLTLGLTLARAEAASVDVFDARGRLVRHLLRQTLPAGTHTLEWDGRDAGDRRAPAGIYFVRYTDGRAIEVRRAVLLR
jgi:flagellar hook assembly protein FlgD